MLTPLSNPSQFAAALTQHVSSHQAAGSQSANFHGRNAQVATSPASLLSNAAEELTMMMGEAASKRLADRKGKEKSKNADLASRLEVYQKLLEQESSRGRPIQQSDFLENCSSNMPLPEDMLDSMLRQMFANERDRAAAMMELLKSDMLQGEGTADVRRMVENKLADIAEIALAEVNAYIAAMNTSEEFASLGSNSELVDAFHGALFDDFRSLPQMLDRLAARFGVTNLDQSLDFLFTALGASMATVIMASEKEMLELRLRDMKMARRLKQVYLGAFMVLVRLKEEHKEDPGEVTPETMTQKMLDLFSKTFVGMSDVKRLMNMFRFHSLQSELLFTQDNFQMVKDLPVDTFETDERRGDVVEAYQHALDELIQKEEEELGF